MGFLEVNRKIYYRNIRELQMRLILKTLKLWVTFMGAGACILIGASMVLLRIAPSSTKRVTLRAAKLLDSAVQQAKHLYGTGVRL